ncbi:unnamed protein product, partial [Polarella glacialis]
MVKPLVEFRNTRFNTKQQVDQDNSLIAAIVIRRARADGIGVEEAMAKMAKEGNFTKLFKVGQLHDCGHGRAVGGKLQSPLMNHSYGTDASYGLVSTPALVPGEAGLSPLMTYGQIASTPRLIEEEDRGPRFQMGQVSGRELAAEKLIRGATQRQRKSQQNSKKERLKALGLTPSEKLTP